MAFSEGLGREPDLRLARKLREVNWFLLTLLALIAGIGFAMLYSASGGNVEPWASRQMIRFAVGLGILLIVALIDLRTWMRYAYAIYALGLILLLAVEVFGVIGMGARRWVDLGLFQLQPSEIMKIALVLALARYFHGVSHEDVGRLRFLLLPTLMLAAPVILVLRQPDLGTAALLGVAGTALFFLAGVRWWKFAALIAAVIGAVPVAWRFLHEYQQDRIRTFLNPERDPLGAGYHIMQSKIALGSGGIFGKGYMLGTQSHLNFLPERQTDFIFTMLAEEFGMLGCLALLGLYLLVIGYGIAIALRSRNQFGRLLAMGLITTFFVYVFINMAMVMGLVPVVGVPLPLVSYGGTSMMTILIGFGLIVCASIHRDVLIARRRAWTSD